MRIAWIVVQPSSNRYVTYALGVFEKSVVKCAVLLQALYGTDLHQTWNSSCSVRLLAFGNHINALSTPSEKRQNASDEV